MVNPFVLDPVHNAVLVILETRPGDEACQTSFNLLTSYQMFVYHCYTPGQSDDSFLCSDLLISLDVMLVWVLSLMSRIYFPH